MIHLTTHCKVTVTRFESKSTTYKSCNYSIAAQVTTSQHSLTKTHIFHLPTIPSDFKFCTNRPHYTPESTKLSPFSTQSPADTHTGSFQSRVLTDFKTTYTPADPISVIIAVSLYFWSTRELSGRFVKVSTLAFEATKNR